MDAKQAYEILNLKLQDFVSKEEKEILLEIIKTSPTWACEYAKDVIKDRWIEAEEYIKKDPCNAYYYARDVIKGRWIEAEEIIKKDPYWAYNYAKNVIKGRFLEAEEYIKKDSEWAYHYARDVIRGRWIEAEEYIALSVRTRGWDDMKVVEQRRCAYDYAKYIIKDENFWDKRAALISFRESIKSEPAKPTKPVEKTSSKDEIISALERLCS